jgi:ketosteroid isomerase-like protein
METKDTAEIIRRFNEAFVTHNPDLLTDLIAEDCVMESIQPAPNGTRYEGREACLGFWQALAADGNVQFAPEDVLVLDGHAVVRWRVTFGTGSVDGVFDGVEAANANSVRGVNLTTVRDGQIVESLGYSKTP